MLLRAILAVSLLQSVAHAEEIVVERAVLSLIEHADVPAEQAGRLEKLLVREGDVVKAGQLLVQLDEREAKLALERAELEYVSAKSLADDLSRIESAKMAVERQRQIAVEQRIDFDVAQSEALNDVAVRAADKAREVAANEHNRGVRSRDASKNSVSESALDGLRLELEKSTLTYEQAQFQLSVLKMKLEGKKAAMKTQLLAIVEADLAVKEAEALQKRAVLQAELKGNDIEAARQNVARRAATSPIDGVVVELPRHTGEWVQPGEKVARVIRLSQMRAEGFLPLARTGTTLVGRAAIVEVATTDRGVISRPARIVFVSPDVDPINQEVRVWAEFDNPDAALLPGLRAKIRILDAAASTTASKPS